MGAGPGPSVYYFLGVSLDDQPLAVAGAGWGGTKMVGGDDVWFCGGGVGKGQDQVSWIQSLVIKRSIQGSYGPSSQKEGELCGKMGFPPSTSKRKNQDKTELSKDFESPASGMGIFPHMAKGVPPGKGSHRRKCTRPGKLGGIQGANP